MRSFAVTTSLAPSEGERAGVRGPHSLSASNADPRSRERERVAAGRVRDVGERTNHVVRCRAAFCGCFGPEAREILNNWKCATDGELQFTLPAVLKALTISKHGKVAEIIGKFGGADQLRNAVSQLQSLLYEA